MSDEIQKIKTYPNNFEAEKSLLCCILIDGEVSSDIIPVISEDLFYNERHKRIFKAAQNLFRKNASIDLITVNDQLEKDKNTDINMLSYLNELASYLPSAANYQEYLNILTRDMILRRVITACNKIIEDAYYSEDAMATLANAEKMIYDISSVYQRGELEHISRASNELMSRLNELCRNKSAFKGLTTYFPRLDSITNGLQKGDLIILAARPSVGKTSFALNIAANMVSKRDKDSVICIFSMEMPAVHLAQRILSSVTNLKMDVLSRGNLGSAEQEELWSAHTELSNSKIYVDQTALQTPGSIFSKCRRLAVKEKRLDLIIIDYLQLMTLEPGKRRDSKNTEVSDISRMMKLLAREMNCPVIVLSQMSRGIESRDDKTPKLSDLRESGAIEQDADIVMFLSREDENAPKNKPNFPIILDILKHRNGELAAIRYNWEGPNVRFTESDDQYINRELPVKKAAKN